MVLKEYDYSGHVISSHLSRSLQWLLVSNSQVDKGINGGVDKVMWVSPDVRIKTSSAHTPPKSNFSQSSPYLSVGKLARTFKNVRTRYQFKCNLCDTGSYVGYMRGHLLARVDGHKSRPSSVRKHYDNDHAGAVPEDLLSYFKVLKKCMNKFDCLVNEMLYIKQLTPSLNVQTDSIRAKVFV